VAEVNLFLRGFAGYFRFGNSAAVFGKIRKYAIMRIGQSVGKQHKRGRSWGFAAVYRSRRGAVGCAPVLGYEN
jgi:hypothetical protein